MHCMDKFAVVSDSTTLIVLQKLGNWELLSNLFDKVYIPPKVMAEVSEKAVLDIPFIEQKSPADTKTVNLLKALLDDGESEAIALAIELNLALIIDEKKGRKTAEAMNVSIVGFVGILLQNIKLGYLSKDDAANIIMQAEEFGMRISSELKELFI